MPTHDLAHLGPAVLFLTLFLKSEEGLWECSAQKGQVSLFFCPCTQFPNRWQDALCSCGEGGIRSLLACWPGYDHNYCLATAM